MADFPVFGDRSALPRRLAGLELHGVEVYDDPRAGASVRYHGPHGLKADAYLYDLGLPSIPADLRSPEVMEWFQEACRGVFLYRDRGLYHDLEVRDSRFLHLPTDAPEPFCLHACFAYRQEPGEGVAHEGMRVSHLALRIDRGFINKVRFTYPDDADFARVAAEAFLVFLLGWAKAVQEAGAPAGGT
ncbi:MAG: hypothetical protein K2W96_06285 [Gemmataceae bacterium]|nr:hypothetical protein [Gemmataceae bacterium]